MAGSKIQLFTGEVIRKFTHTGEFLSEVPDKSTYVNADVINVTELGVKPDVLINNTTYPIPIQESEDGNIEISLDKFQTKSTNISDDEIENLPYDKIKEYAQSHVESLEESTADKAAHALAPALNSTATPIILATGVENEEGVYSLAVKDIVTLKKKFDDLKLPKKGRVLVLCNAHVADLLNTSESFEKQYKDIREGQLLKLYGFTIYEHQNCPQYYLDGAAWKKRGFGLQQAGDREASFAFFAPRTFKARGTVKMFRKNAVDDPDTQSTRFNYKMRFVTLPYINEGIAALISPDHA